MNEFTTKRLQLAVYLHAAGRLRYLRTEPVPNNPSQAQFVFADPQRAASRLEFNFESGDAVPAKSIFASQNFLRRCIADVLNQNSNYGAEREHESQPASNPR
jgi:hypothetical protein